MDELQHAMRQAAISGIALSSIILAGFAWLRFARPDVYRKDAHKVRPLVLVVVVSTLQQVLWFDHWLSPRWHDRAQWLAMILTGVASIWWLFVLARILQERAHAEEHGPRRRGAPAR